MLAAHRGFNGASPKARQPGTRESKCRAVRPAWRRCLARSSALRSLSPKSRRSCTRHSGWQRNGRTAPRSAGALHVLVGKPAASAPAPVSMGLANATRHGTVTVRFREQCISRGRMGEAMFKKSSRFNTSLRQRGLSPQSASHAHVGVAKGRRKSRKVLDLEASAKGRTVREWFAYLTACKQQGSPAYGVPEEILDAWTVAQYFEA